MAAVSSRNAPIQPQSVFQNDVPTDGQNALLLAHKIVFFNRYGNTLALRRFVHPENFSLTAHPDRFCQRDFRRQCHHKFDGAPAIISVSKYMNTPRELTSRVRPANYRLPFSRNFTEMGRSSENRLVVRFSGCGCAMLASKYSGSFGTILAYIGAVLPDILKGISMFSASKT